jgi:hypothetical protein
MATPFCASSCSIRDGAVAGRPPAKTALREPYAVRSTAASACRRSSLQRHRAAAEVTTAARPRPERATMNGPKSRSPRSRGCLAPRRDADDMVLATRLGASGAPRRRVAAQRGDVVHADAAFRGWVQVHGVSAVVRPCWWPSCRCQGAPRGCPFVAARWLQSVKETHGEALPPWQLAGRGAATGGSPRRRGPPGAPCRSPM